VRLPLPSSGREIVEDDQQHAEQHVGTAKKYPLVHCVKLVPASMALLVAHASVKHDFHVLHWTLPLPLPLKLLLAAAFSVENMLGMRLATWLASHVVSAIGEPPVNRVRVASHHSR
jgi:hypothetical protein